MKFMKRISILFLGVFLLTSLVGCTNSDTSSEKDKTSTTTQSTTSGNLSDIVDNLIPDTPQNDVGTYVTPDDSSFTYETIEGGVAITSYTGTDKAIIVPNTLGGQQVVSIQSGAFNEAGIIGLKLPDSLPAIDENAFYYCTTLQEIYLGSNTAYIGGHAFEGCFSLSKIVLNVSLQRIEEYAFAACQSLKTIDFNAQLTDIALAAFCMSGLTEVSIPGTVKTIGVSAFTTCNDLAKVEIASGVTVIDEQAFQGNPALKTAIIPDSVTEIRLWAFGQCPELTIYGSAGSVAESYATDAEISFIAQ